MLAVVFDRFGELPRVRAVPEPVPSEDGVVVAVEATGVCRSDWHAWQGHDDVRLPHVPGHELAGRIAALGAGVRGWAVGDRVTVPFVCACGRCEQCAAGMQQVCDHQSQPGFTHWGSFAEQVAVHHAEVNLVRLPDGMSSVTAASLGCRFATAYRAVLRQGELRPGQWVAVHGCGGAGASAVMLAAAAGAKVVAVDISRDALNLATSIGAVATVHGPSVGDTAAEVVRLTEGGAHLSLDCIGLPETCAASVASLRKRGTHVQVGLMPPALGVPPVPMDRVIAGELRIVGSHGMQAHEYPGMLRFVERAGLDLDRLVGSRISMAEAPDALRAMSGSVLPARGVTVVDLTAYPVHGFSTDG